MGDTVHGKEEFGDIDWNFVDERDKQGYVTFAMGGNYLPDGTWTLNVGHNDGIHYDVYVLPDYLQYMIKTINQWGKDEFRQKSGIT